MTWKGKALLVAFIAFYVWMPKDAWTGPLDDLIVILVGMQVLKRGCLQKE